MSKPMCVCLVTLPYLWPSVVGTMQVTLNSCLSFGDSNTINHFYCADPTLLMLMCCNWPNSCPQGQTSPVSLLTSQVFIFTTIARISSSMGQRRAPATCGSHLTTVSMFYSFLFCVYLRPANKLSVEQGKVVSVFCIFVSPMLNPFICSLRNKNVMQALGGVFITNPSRENFNPCSLPLKK